MSSKSRKPRMNKYNGCYRLKLSIRVIKQHDKRTSGTPGFTLVVFVFVLYRFVVFVGALCLSVLICIMYYHEMVWKLTSGLKTTLPTATESLLYSVGRC